MAWFGDRGRVVTVIYGDCYERHVTTLLPRSLPRTFLPPYGWPFPGELAGFSPAKFSVSFEASPLFFATGVIQGFRVCGFVQLWSLNDVQKTTTTHPLAGPSPPKQTNKKETESKMST